MTWKRLRKRMEGLLASSIYVQHDLYAQPALHGAFLWLGTRMFTGPCAGGKTTTQCTECYLFSVLVAVLCVLEPVLGL